MSKIRKGKKPKLLRSKFLNIKITEFSSRNSLFTFEVVHGSLYSFTDVNQIEINVLQTALHVYLLSNTFYNRLKMVHKKCIMGLECIDFVSITVIECAEKNFIQSVQF